MRNLKKIIKETIRQYLNEQVELNDLKELAKKYDYDTFINKTDNLVDKYFILYRGTYNDQLTDDSFFSDYVGHAREYGDYVDGIIINNNDMIYFDDIKFNYIRDNFSEILGLVKKYFYDDEDRYDYYKEYKDIYLKKLREIYEPYVDSYKLTDAMYHYDYDIEKIINYVYKFITQSNNSYEKEALTKKNDFFMPLLMYYVKSIGKNIVSFWGSDFSYAGGMQEFVVNDISKYPKLSDIWKSVN